MDIAAASRSYEHWMAGRTRLIPGDLRLKHQFMASALFPFLRATFYRWLQVWPEVCPQAATAPRVLAVGDLHVENFGTWRDIEGRLIWGINDFDEVSHMPYTIDLVRLTTSALLAAEAEHLALKPRLIADCIEEGYRSAVATGGRAFVLSNRSGWLRRVAMHQIAEGPGFWEKLLACPPVDASKVPATARAAIEHAMPQKRLRYGYARRGAGLGSRGHQRYVSVVDWCGGLIAREAKALVPSAAVWLRHHSRSGPILYAEVLRRAIRCPDPHFHVADHWIVRRLSPNCRKISIAELPEKRNEERLLYSMGAETANVHLGAANARATIRRDLAKRPADWLLEASRAMMKSVRRDWKDWKKA
ncbi:MAG TPA: DUF2252 family protein [Candidatus Acidoferrales bacterium]|nr:DUF2252 family protein [Candidatus Acidoferrales bacterium]